MELLVPGTKFLQPIVACVSTAKIRQLSSLTHEKAQAVFTCLITSPMLQMLTIKTLRVMSHLLTCLLNLEEASASAALLSLSYQRTTGASMRLCPPR